MSIIYCEAAKAKGAEESHSPANRYRKSPSASNLCQEGNLNTHKNTTNFAFLEKGCDKPMRRVSSHCKLKDVANGAKDLLDDENNVRA